MNLKTPYNTRVSEFTEFKNERKKEFKMTVNEFLKIVTKDNQVAEYNQEVTIQTYATIDSSPDGEIRRTLAQGKAYEILEMNDIENVVQGLQSFDIIEIRRIPKGNLPAYNCPYLLLVS